MREKSEGHGNPFDVAFNTKNIDRQRDVQDAFPAENIPADPLNNVSENFLLFLHLLRIHVLQPFSWKHSPLALP